MFKILLFALVIVNCSYADQNNKIETVLVLGSGGAKGVAHIGVIEELLNSGVTFDAIIGCSSGAIIGALYADCMDINHVAEVILPLDIDQLTDSKKDTVLNFFKLNKLSSWVEGQKFLKKNLVSRSFEELKVPLFLVATNIDNGEAKTFSSGELIESIKASASFPCFFEPLDIEGNFYLDGGLSSPLPVKVAKFLNPSKIISVDVSGGVKPNYKNDSNYLNTASHCIDILTNSLVKNESELSDFVIRVDFDDIKDASTFSLNPNNNKRFYKAGKAAARKFLDSN